MSTEANKEYDLEEVQKLSKLRDYLKELNGEGLMVLGEKSFSVMPVEVEEIDGQIQRKPMSEDLKRSLGILSVDSKDVIWLAGNEFALVPGQSDEESVFQLYNKKRVHKQPKVTFDIINVMVDGKPATEFGYARNLMSSRLDDTKEYGYGGGIGYDVVPVLHLQKALMHSDAPLNVHFRNHPFYGSDNASFSKIMEDIDQLKNKKRQKHYRKLLDGNVHPLKTVLEMPTVPFQEGTFEGYNYTRRRMFENPVFGSPNGKYHYFYLSEFTQRYYALYDMDKCNEKNLPNIEFANVYASDRPLGLDEHPEESRFIGLVSFSYSVTPDHAAGLVVSFISHDKHLHSSGPDFETEDEYLDELDEMPF